ncbi:MAG: AAA family ATPase, partial [Patulibacter sp.]|nr:AAA family ATPase [Patulibacter sp.]
RLLQFHPSYAYEDFVEGYRPRSGENGALAYDLVAGPFKAIAEEARVDPDHPYVLIIDEINRGNLAKVFGELYFLLEYRDE